MVRAGGLAYRIIGDKSSTDPGGGGGGSRRGRPAWQLPVGRGTGHSWTPSTQAFPPLGSRPTVVSGRDNRQLPVRTKVGLGSRSPMVLDSQMGPLGSNARKNGRGMRPAAGDRQSPPKVKGGRLDGSDRMIVVSEGPMVRENKGVVPLSVKAEEFYLGTVSKVRVPTGGGTDRSVPSRETPEGVVGRNGDVVLTTAEAGGPRFRPLSG